MNIVLERTIASASRYQDYRNRHYIPNKKCIGMQCHYLVFVNNEQVGIISGSSPSWSVRPRDSFFGLDDHSAKRGMQLKAIVNNSVFRLEMNTPNLGSQILSRFRKQVARDWFAQYSIKVVGFETFVEPSENRHGSLYLADNWTHVGITQGHAKLQKSCRASSQSVIRQPTTQKLIYCKWNKGHHALPSVDYAHQFDLAL